MDITPILDAIIKVASIAILAVGTWGLQRFATWMKIRKNSEALASWEDALTKSIHAAAACSTDLIKEKGYDHVDVKSAILRLAAPYLMSWFVPILRSMGLDPNDPIKTQNYIMSELDRKFPTAMSDFVNSPVTPSFPALPAVPSGPSVTTKDLNIEELEELDKAKGS